MSNEECETSIVNECYCPACQGDKAATTLLLKSVPYFREITVMNLSCAVCGYRNAQTSFGGSIQDKGQRITLTVTHSRDLNRQFVKSDSASLYFPALKLEIPASKQQGKITTLEGMLQKTAEDLTQQQSERLLVRDVDNFHRCASVIDTLRCWLGQKEITSKDDNVENENTPIFPWDVILDDPAGNSFIENPQAPQQDPQLSIVQYLRTPEQDTSLGLLPPRHTEMISVHTKDDSNPCYKAHALLQETVDSSEHWDPNSEVIKFPTPCPNCSSPTETNMSTTNIPHFQQFILMCMVCSACGYRSNDIQGNGGAISEYGTRLILNVTDMNDLSRDVLKSDTAAIHIPEIDLEVGGGSLGGLYSTVEGILTKIVEHLETSNPFAMGDSAEQRQGDAPLTDGDRFRIFFNKMRAMIQGQNIPFRFILVDPLSNSFIGPRPQKTASGIVTSETESRQLVDESLIREEYERSHAEKEVLGLNDIATECCERPQDSM